MKLEDQVCSLELAKRLKELRVKQESLFYYQNEPFNDDEDDILIKIREEIDSDKESSIINVYDLNVDHPIYNAYTVAELGEMLPDNCYTRKESDSHYKIRISDLDKVIKEWICHRIIDKNEEDLCVSKTEADARAKMLIYLLENGLIKNDR